uniref:TGF-beta family profile domain-containing protein n=1 Tax=Strix occidentalis caurina TaxID=311401 RepID=A0A8D0FAI5_STROC
MRDPLRSAPALALCALALLRLGCAPTRAPTRAPTIAPTHAPAPAPTRAAPRAPPRCPPLMLQLLRAPPAPLRSLQNGSRWALAFDMSSLSSSQEVSLAQLRVLSPARDVSLDIYHSRRRRCRGDGACAPQLFLGTVAGSAASTQASWKVFEVTSLLRSWLHQAVAPGHHGPTGREATGSAAPATTTMRLPTSSDTGHSEPALPQDVTDRVLLLVFSKDKSPGGHSLIRTAETSKHVMRDSGSQGAGTRRHRRNRKEKSLCRRVDMMVDFEQTGWGSWIVYPKKYNAYRCEGLCPSPVDETFKPTNHAYIQSLLQLYKPNQVPCPACSPVRMSPLSMLYYEKGEIVVRHHEDMIIEECGCN